MVTTFFAEHSFGGDAAYVDRLSRALLNAGHDVSVIYNVDAFELTRRAHPTRDYQPPEGLKIHRIRSPLGKLNALYTHQTSRAGLHRRELRHLFETGNFDVIHFHNISLLGALGALRLAAECSPAIRLMSTHDHWLTCPLSLLWKRNREVCREPSCTACTLAARRPPQLWRSTGVRERALASLDALIVASEHTKRAHHERGIKRDITVLPYFLPDNLVKQADETTVTATARPYFAAAGRLIKEKGFDEAIEVMRRVPDADLLIAGTGPYEDTLRAQAAGASNVRFVGLLDYRQLLEIYKGSVALVVPSQFYETFGFVVLEAFSTATPVIVNDLGPLPAHVHKSGAGLIYQSPHELESRLTQLLEQPSTALQLGQKGRALIDTEWSEALHINRYLATIKRCQQTRQM